MQTQRKLLTEEQKKAICQKHDNCSDCPLMMEIGFNKYCFQVIMGIEQDIKEYWNEEIEVDIDG